MKKYICNVFLVILVFACIVSTFSGCKKTSIDPQKYTSYRCYDYHLKCLKVEGKRARAEFSYRSDSTGVESTHRAWIQQIDGESEDMFIYTEVLPPLPLGPSYKIVMQNPNNYVDIWKEWSVEKIELYYIDDYKPIAQNKPANIPTAVIATTSETGCLSDMKKLVDTSDERNKQNIPDGYVKEGFDENGSGYNYYIRVYFKESENIVWDSCVEIYYSSENKDRIIYIDVGKEPWGIASVKANYVNISNYTSLMDWIVTSITDN